MMSTRKDDKDTKTPKEFQKTAGAAASRPLLPETQKFLEKCGFQGIHDVRALNSTEVSPNVYVKMEQNASPLYFAVFLLNHLKPHERPPHIESIIRDLITAGADVNFTPTWQMEYDEYGRLQLVSPFEPIVSLVYKTNNPSLLKQVVEHGAKLSHPNFISRLYHAFITYNEKILRKNSSFKITEDMKKTQKILQYLINSPTLDLTLHPVDNLYGKSYGSFYFEKLLAQSDYFSIAPFGEEQASKDKLKEILEFFIQQERILLSLFRKKTIQERLLPVLDDPPLMRNLKMGNLDIVAQMIVTGKDESGDLVDTGAMNEGNETIFDLLKKLCPQFFDKNGRPIPLNAKQVQEISQQHASQNERRNAYQNLDFHRLYFLLHQAALRDAKTVVETMRFFHTMTASGKVSANFDLGVLGIMAQKIANEEPHKIVNLQFILDWERKMRWERKKHLAAPKPKKFKVPHIKDSEPIDVEKLAAERNAIPTPTQTLTQLFNEVLREGKQIGTLPPPKPPEESSTYEQRNKALYAPEPPALPKKAVDVKKAVEFRQPPPLPPLPPKATVTAKGQKPPLPKIPTSKPFDTKKAKDTKTIAATATTSTAFQVWREREKNAQEQTKTQKKAKPKDTKRPKK